LPKNSVERRRSKKDLEGVARGERTFRAKKT